MATLNLRDLLPDAPAAAPHHDRELALEAHRRLAAAGIYGRTTPARMGEAAGTTWREIHAMADAGFIRLHEAKPIPNTDKALVTYFVFLS